MDHAVAARLHIVEMLEEMLAARRVVLLSRIIDENGRPEYAGSVSGPNKHSAAGTLEGCVEDLTEHPRMKICLRADCIFGGEPRALHKFGPDKDSADGHSAVCKKCEAKRIGGLSKKRKNSASKGD